MSKEKEEVIAQIKGWKDMDAGWDGEHAVTPKPKSIQRACEFVQALKNTHVVPEPILHNSGYIGLCWMPGGQYYAEVEFIEGDKLVYYFRTLGTTVKGVIVYDGNAIPAVVKAELPKKGLDDKIRFFLLEIKTETEVLHSEIIQVKSQKEDPAKLIYGVSSVVLESLFARDSMSAASTVLRIRQRMRDCGNRTENVLTDITDQPTAEQQYKDQETKRKEGLNDIVVVEPLRATYNHVW